MSVGTLAPGSKAPAANYWRDSSRPLVSLAFVAPLLALYEGGVTIIGCNAIRSGADAWLRRCLELAGFGQYFLLPLLTCALLLAWHHARHEPWRIDGGVIARMWIEAAAWGGGLIFMARTGLLLGADGLLGNSAAAIVEAPSRDVTARLIGYIGAGIYEELLFRLILLTAAFGVLRGARLSRTSSLMSAILLTSLLFAAAHYRWDATWLGLPLEWTGGEPFLPLGFAFRLAGGIFLATLFAYRGIGIAVGAHAAYDLFVLLG